MRNWWLVLLLSLPAIASAGGDGGELPTVKLSPRNAPAAVSPLPAWRALTFLEQAMWATASSRLELGSCEHNRDLWCLEATSSVVSNQENIQLTAAAGGRLLERKRSSAGSDRRRKNWSYGLTAATRERQEPDANGNWRLTSSRKLPYPPGDLPVTDSIFLLVLAEPGRQAREFMVNTDMNFYRVTATAAGEDLIEVDADIDGSRDLRQVDLVALVAEPVEPLADKPDFNLLGLSGNIVIAFDRATGIPVQVRGKAPRIGMAELTLKSLERRDAKP